MAEIRDESFVYVRRPNKISHSLSIFENPMKRRRLEEDSSLKMCKKIEPVKAILSDPEFEVHEQDNELQSSVSFERKKSKLNDDIEADNDQRIFIMDLKFPKIGEMEYSDFETDIYRKKAITKSLFDVQVMVKSSSYRAENVPFVCLTSQSNGQAILGYPLQIHVLNDEVRETLCSKRENIFPRLVWKTSKRTPVCYVASMAARKENDVIAEDSINPAGEDGKGKDRSHHTNLMKDTKRLRQEAKIGSCVPVEFIFSKLLAAVGRSAA